MTYSPTELAAALGLPPPTDEQAAVIAAPPGPLVVIAGAGAGKTETMAARVVWLVANGYADPGQVLGLTFTRKAAGQLLRRVRSRLARLAGHLVAASSRAAPAVSTYHAFAGALLREHGLLLPVEPDARLLSETELWQLAFDVVSAHPGPLDDRQEPGQPSPRWCCGCPASWPSTSSTPTSCATPTSSSSGWCTPCRPVRYQRDRGPSQWLLDMLGHPDRTHRAGAADRRPACPDARREGDGLRQRRWPRPPGWPSAFPQVGEQLRAALPGGAARRVPGHRPRPARRAVGVVRRRGRRRPGADRGRRPDPVDLRLARGVGHQPAAVHHRLPATRTAAPAPTLELRTSWRNPPRALHLANAVSAEARRRSVAVRALRARPGAAAGHGPVRAAARCRHRTGLGRRPRRRPIRRRRRGRRVAAHRGGAGAPQRRRRADGRGADRPGRAGRGGRAGRSAVDPRGGRRGGDAAAGRRPDGGRSGDAGAHRSALAAGRARPRRAVAARRGARRAAAAPRLSAAADRRRGGAPTPTPPAWPTHWPIPARPRLLGGGLSPHHRARRSS